MDDSLVSGIFAGIIVGFLSWIIHLVTNTSPCISISKNICKDDRDGYYRIKIRNNGLANVAIVKANIIVSYNPNLECQDAKNDLLLEGKYDPLLFGIWEFVLKGCTLRTFDTFVLDAQKMRRKPIETKASKVIQEKHSAGQLSIGDFFQEDDTAIISAVFDVRNYRTGKTRSFYRIYRKKDIVYNRHFKSGWSLKISEPQDENPKGSDTDNVE